MISLKIKDKISQIYIDYTNNIYQIPKLDDIIELNSNDMFFQFKISDLYRKKYILYFDSQVEDEIDEFLYQNLFHEFTHVADSLNFLDKDIDYFKNVMFIYSEIHASQIQMDKMLKTQQGNSYKIDKDVTYGGILTLQSFMDQSLDHAIKEFDTSNGGTHDIRNTYYFIGYLKSLKEHGISYNYIYNVENQDLVNAVAMLTEDILNDKYTYDRLIKIDKYIEAIIKGIISRSTKSNLFSKITSMFNID